MGIDTAVKPGETRHMKHIILALVAIVALTGCTMPEETPSSLRGTWYLDGVKAITFTDDEMIQYSGSFEVRYGFLDYGDGTGSYWIQGYESAAVDLSYKFVPGGVKVGFGNMWTTYDKTK